MAGAADAPSRSSAPSQACARPACNEPPSGSSQFCSLECKEHLEAKHRSMTSAMTLASSLPRQVLEEARGESSILGLETRDALLSMREAAIKEREKALNDLEEAMRLVKADLEAQPTAPEVARSTKRRPQRRGRFAYVVIASPRKSRSPTKARSPNKGRRCRVSLASTSAASSCNSPGRRSRRSRQSCASLASRSMEEPPPARLPEQELLAPEAPYADSLLGSFPLPLGISAWDWPLSRDEKKSLVLMFDRQELMVQRDEFAEQLIKVRCVLSGAA